MRAVTPRAAPPDPAPYAAAEVAFAEAKAYLSSREAQQMSESDLERELHRRGQELMRKLLQGHLDQRSPGEAAGPVEGADGVERPEPSAKAAGNSYPLRLPPPRQSSTLPPLPQTTRFPQTTGCCALRDLCGTVRYGPLRGRRGLSYTPERLGSVFLLSGAINL